MSQAEQRLNALNPSADKDNQRIFSFSLADRENYAVTLDDPRGRKIVSNMVLYDLFSFDVAEHGHARSNFEALFGRYESSITRDTLQLVAKLQRGAADIKAEILNILAAKFMNFLRNPHSVKKILNTIGNLGGYHPLDPDLLRQYSAVLAGKKPQQEHLSLQLGITPAEYRAWLSALFMVLTRHDSGEPNLLECIVKALFEEPSNEVLVTVFYYTDEHLDKRCLLADRGYSTPVPEDEHLSFSFNLRSSAFITYVFADIEKAAPKAATREILETYKKRHKVVKVTPAKNDLRALSNYNRNVVYQCFNAVYSSSHFVYGVNLWPPHQ